MPLPILLQEPLELHRLSSELLIAPAIIPAEHLLLLQNVTDNFIRMSAFDIRIHDIHIPGYFVLRQRDDGGKVAVLGLSK